MLNSLKEFLTATCSCIASPEGEVEKKKEKKKTSRRRFKHILLSFTFSPRHFPTFFLESFPT